MRGAVIILFTCAAICTLTACGDAKSSDPVEQMPADDAVAGGYREVVRHLALHVSGPYVVTLAEGATVDDHAAHRKIGEGILWGAKAMGLLGCRDGAQLTQDVLGAVESGDGEITRYHDLSNYAGREINFDGETGVYFGFAYRTAKCPGDRAALASAWAKRLAYVDRNGGRLYRTSDHTMPAEFTFTRDAISHALGLRTAPHTDRLRTLEAQIAGWATAVQAGIAAWRAGLRKDRPGCYRMNLALMHLQAIEALGYELSGAGRSAFCSATDGMEIPTVDDWCGRSPIRDWITSDYQRNSYEYRHQRCSFETERMGGLVSPWLDLVEGYQQGYTGLPDDAL